MLYAHAQFDFIFHSVLYKWRYGWRQELSENIYFCPCLIYNSRITWREMLTTWKITAKIASKMRSVQCYLKGRTFIFCSSFGIESHRKSLVTESKSKLNVWKTFLKRFATCLQLKNARFCSFWHLNMWNKGQKWPTPVMSRNDVINAEKCTLFKTR